MEFTCNRMDDTYIQNIKYISSLLMVASSYSHSYMEPLIDSNSNSFRGD